jgi:hypothetical protein
MMLKNLSNKDFIIAIMNVFKIHIKGKINETKYMKDGEF